MKALLTAAMAAWILAGCATEPPSASELRPAPASQLFAPPVTSSEPARITVVRDGGGALVYYHVSLDGKRIASLDSGQFFVFAVDPGEHVFEVMPTQLLGAHKPTSIETNWRPGQRALYRIGADSASRVTIARDPASLGK